MSFEQALHRGVVLADAMGSQMIFSRTQGMVEGSGPLCREWGWFQWGSILHVMHTLTASTAQDDPVGPDHSWHLPSPEQCPLQQGGYSLGLFSCHPSLKLTHHVTVQWESQVTGPFRHNLIGTWAWGGDGTSQGDKWYLLVVEIWITLFFWTSVILSVK